MPAFVWLSRRSLHALQVVLDLAHLLTLFFSLLDYLLFSSLDRLLKRLPHLGLVFALVPQRRFNRAVTHRRYLAL